MHTCGSSAPLVPWRMQPTLEEGRRVLLCVVCGRTKVVIAYTPIHAESLDYRSSLAKLIAHGATQRGHNAAEAKAKL